MGLIIDLRNQHLVVKVVLAIFHGGNDMFREIVGFRQDELGDWVAELSCLHAQYVRHRPPFQIRPWVLDDDERNSRVGTLLSCSLCDRCQLPEGVVLDSVVGPWNRSTLPKGLLSAHKVPAGTWGVLKVKRGSVQFDIQVAPPMHLQLSEGDSQAIPPEILHNVNPGSDAELEIEFWTR